jgi:hypothetical protein
MNNQNYKNHRRFVPMFHYVLLAFVLTINVFAIINLFSCKEGGNWVLNIMFVLIGLSLLIGFACIRTFPLKVQDRAIRAEENLRHFVLTGKPLDKNLKIGQIIALRFASDEEYIELAERALKENMSNNDIKKAIKNWREDNHRA